MSETYEGVGTIIKVYGNNNFTVSVQSEEEEEETREVLCYMSGKMCRHRIKVIPGDEVMVKIPPPFDRGVITFRGRKDTSPPTEAKKKKARQKGRGRGRRR